MASARTVAVVVPSPATSLVCFETSRTICAPMFSNGSSSSISEAIETPSRETIGVPSGRSMTAFMPLGPKVPLTARVNLATPRASAARASASCNIIFGIPHPLTNCRRTPAESGPSGESGLWSVEAEALTQQAAAEGAVELGVHADPPHRAHIDPQRLGLQPVALRVDKGAPGVSLAHNAAPLEISSPQGRTRVVEIGRRKLLEAHVDELRRGEPGGDKMIEQRGLSPLERLDEKRPPKRAEIVIRLIAKCFGERKPALEAFVDLLGVHVLADCDFDLADPGERSNREPHVVGHQIREVRRAPIGRQTKPNPNLLARLHVDIGDEAQIDHRFVEFGINHAAQSVPNLGAAVLDGCNRHGQPTPSGARPPTDGRIRRPRG